MTPQQLLARLFAIKPWVWLALGLGVLNVSVFLLGLFAPSVFSGNKTVHALSAGVRADWVKIQTPWIKQNPVVTQAATKIDLKQGRENLDKALAAGLAKVQQEVVEPRQCKLWGPLLPNEWVRVADALARWPGQIEKQERQVAVGYIVYLPADQAKGGASLLQLQRKGIKELFLMNEAGALQGAISLGLFRDLARATLQQQELLAKGVEGVLIQERLGPPRTFYRLTGTSAQITELDEIHRRNPRGSLQACGG